MLSRYLFPLSLCLGHVTQSSTLMQRFDTVLQRDLSLYADLTLQQQLESLKESMEATEEDLEKQQRILDDLRQKSAQRSGDDSKPMSKKQRRLEYVNELLSHNSDLKKQSLIKVINNLNKCGVECTLSTQGKGSHITLSVDGKKHTISSKMQIGHLKRDLEESGVDFSFVEHTSEIRSDQNLKEHEIRVEELTQLLKSLNIDIEELKREQQQLKDELESQKENVEEAREAYLFSLTVELAKDLIIHRSYGRTKMIWPIYDAVMADLPYFGQQWDFKRAVKRKVRESKDDWGCGVRVMYEIQVCSTKAHQTRLNYYDGLAAAFEIERDSISNIPVSQFMDPRLIDLFSLAYHNVIDGILLIDGELLDQGMESFMDENQRRPDLFEFQKIMDASKQNESNQIELVIFGWFMNFLLKYHELMKTEMIPEHQHILQKTELNPNDDPECLKDTYGSEQGTLNDIPFDRLIQISELYDRCGCHMIQGAMGLASHTALQIWDRDHDKAVLFVEKLLNQGPFHKKDDICSEMFTGMRGRCAEYLYNQAMQKINEMHVSKQFSAAPLIDIERSERIYGPMWFCLKGFSVNQLSITLLCLELGDRPRAIQECSRISSNIKSDMISVWDCRLRSFDFDINGREIMKHRQEWVKKIERETNELKTEQYMGIVIFLKSLMKGWNQIWEDRANRTLDVMDAVPLELENQLSKVKNTVWIQVRYPELVREMKEMKQRFEDYIKRAKGETVEKKHPPKKKKTQKRGKRGKH